MTLPTERTTLMRLITDERKRFEETLMSLSAEQLSVPELDGGWSAKDAMAHIAFWEGNMLERIERAATGEQIERPDWTREEWDTFINQRNAQAYEQAKDYSLDEVRRSFAASYQRVLDKLNELTDLQLFDPSGISAQLGFNVIDLIAGDTYEHYKEHGDAIRTHFAHYSPI